MRVALLLVVVYLCGWIFVPADPLEQHRELAQAAPSAQHWLGCDDFGRDVLSRFLAGGSWSVLIGAVATVFALVSG